jgi:hypothetical protein
MIMPPKLIVAEKKACKAIASLKHKATIVAKKQDNNQGNALTTTRSSKRIRANEPEPSVHESEAAIAIKRRKTVNKTGSINSDS